MNSTDSLVPAPPPSDFNSMLAPVWMRIVAGCICIPITIFGGLGNFTILLAFALNRKLLWKKQNIYLFCLTITDLLTCIVSAPVTLDQYWSGRWRFTHGWCRSFQIVLSTAFGGSLNFVALIARDRSLMVVKGAAYDTYETAGRKWLYAAVNIVGVSILNIPYHSLDIFTGFSIFVAHGNQCNPEQLQSLYVTIADQLTFTMLPFVFMLYFYARVRKYFRMKRKIGIVPVQAFNNLGAPVTLSASQSAQTPQNNVVAPASTAWSATVAASEKAHRAAKIMSALLISAFQCCVPSTCMSVLMNTLVAHPTLITFKTFIWWSNLYSLTYMWAFNANAVNPFLYAYAMPSYQEAAGNVGRTLMRIVLCKKD